MNDNEKRVLIALTCACIILGTIIIVYVLNARPPSSSPDIQVWLKMHENHTTILSNMQNSYNVSDTHAFALEIDLIRTNNTPIIIDLYFNNSRMLHLEDISGAYSTAIRFGALPSEIESESDIPNHDNFTACFSRQDSDVQVSFRIRTWVVVIIYQEMNSDYNYKMRYHNVQDISRDLISGLLLGPGPSYSSVYPCSFIISRWTSITSVLLRHSA